MRLTYEDIGENVLLENIYKILLHQLNCIWVGADVDGSIIRHFIPCAYERTFASMKMNNYSKYLNEFSPYHSDTWAVFLYNLSHELYLAERIHEAECVYYLNKILHSCDWLYAVDLPVHFWSEHSVGSILGRGKYGDYLLTFQGVTVGENRKNGEIYTPIFGDFIILFANATVLGNTRVGSHVIFLANSYVIDEEIPDNCIVFGQSPIIKIKELSAEEVFNRFSKWWKV